MEPRSVASMLFLFCLPLWQASAADPRETLAQADHYADLGNWDKARDLFAKEIAAEMKQTMDIMAKGGAGANVFKAPLKQAIGHLSGTLFDKGYLAEHKWIVTPVPRNLANPN